MTADGESGALQVTNAGAVSTGDMSLEGTNVAGRDIVIQHQTVQSMTVPTVRPSELPAQVADFVDRQDIVRRLRDVIAGSEPSRPVPVAGVFGPPGVGKTALALRVAHAVSGQFPGGNLFIDLTGAAAAPLQPTAVLGEFLRALGAPRIPDQPEDRARMYRTMLADGRYLIVLDNARDERQVRPLLPGAGTCAVLVTSRRRFVLAESSHAFDLGALDEHSGVELLGAVAGADRVSAQSADAVRIVQSCGGFPLALRIAAARLAGRPHWQLSRLAGRLADERRRLGELDMGDAEVRAGFALSYQGLDSSAQRLFRLLGLADLMDFAPWLPCVLLDGDPDEAADLADELCDAHLLQVVDTADGQPRFRFHDLLRAFARERLEAEPDDAEQAEALERVLGAYLTLAMRADAGFSAANSAVWDRPPDNAVPEQYLGDLSTAPLPWFAAERANLLRIIDQACQRQQWRPAWQLASAMWQFLEVTGRWSDWSTAYGLALEAARRSGDVIAEASCLRLLGRLELNRGDTNAAAAQLEQSFERLAGAGYLHGECMTRKDMSVVERLRDRHHVSSELLLVALDGFRQLDEHYWVAITRRELGIEYRFLHQAEEAEQNFADAIRELAGLGEELQEAQTRFELGVLHRQRGDWIAAQESFDWAAPVVERLGARGLKAWLQRESALVTAGRGDLGAATAALSECLPLWQELEDWRQHAATLHELALVRQRNGELDAAVAVLREAVGEFRRMGEDLAQARATVDLAVALVDYGAPDEAATAVEQALPALRAHADLAGEVRAQRALSAACTARGDERGAQEATVLADGLARYAQPGPEIWR